jgi:S1-C subfamily serine protease
MKLFLVLLQFIIFLNLFLFIFGCEYWKSKSSLDIPTNLAIAEASDRHFDIYHKDGKHLGGGVYFASQGIIFTEYSIVNYPANDLKITQDGDHFFTVQKVILEPKLDLAFLETDIHKNLELPVLKDRSELVILESIFMIGSPYGLEKTYIQGYISHLDRSGLEPKFSMLPFVQITGVSYENTGGVGIYSLDGKLIGINRKSPVTGLENGFGLLIPSGFLYAFWEQYQKN